jgi:group I intron endonuclease
MYSGIYTIRNTATGWVYVGKSTDTARRWKQHRRDLNRGAHSNAKLQWDWVLYGSDAFEFEVVEVIPECRGMFHLLDDREWATICEMKKAGPVYNLPGGMSRRWLKA